MPSSRASRSTSRSRGAPARRGLLDQPVALALSAHDVERAHVVDVDHRHRQRRVAAPRARQLARQLLVPGAACGQAGQRVGEGERAHPAAQRRVRDRHRRLRGEQPQHAGRRVGQRLERRPPDDDQHAGHVAVAQHRLEHGRARTGRLHQQIRQRRVAARVGHEVGLLRGERTPRAGRRLAARLDRHRGHVDAGHRGRHEVAPRRLEQEGDRRACHLAGGLADRRAGVVGAGQRACHAPDRAHPARLVAQHVVEPPQVARVALALELGREHAGEHQEQLLVVLGERHDRVPQRGERADPRAVGELERHAEVAAGADAVLHRQRGVDGLARDVVAQPRRAVVGHVRAERVADRDREVRAQADAAALARVDDAVDELAAVDVREVDHGVGQVPLEQIEDRARRVGERAVRRRRRGRGGLDRACVHGAIVGARGASSNGKSV